VSAQVNSNPECSTTSTSINTVPTLTINYTPNDCESCPDLGFYINKSNLSDELKYKLLTNPYVPSDNYDFKNDNIAQKRNFKIEWLKQYRWLVYSKHLKGGLCKHCAVFRPVVKRGLLGAFIVSAFTKYKDFHFHAKKHNMQSEWHRDSVSQSKDFLKIMSNKEKSVIDKLNTAQHSQIEQNRKKLVPILSSIIFCATHDLAIRGKLSCSGNFHDLLKFRIESGDSVLSEHLSTCHSKAKYTSHRIQNELILLCGNVLCDQIVREVNTSLSFSLLADETSDIAGIEQLSIGVRYVDSSKTIREEFIGFSALQTLDAVGIATSILISVEKYGLDMNKLVGLGFDGCSVMAGKENGVQKIICDKYSKATFFHCASHRLNLVVNDLNAVTEIQNTVGVIKESVLEKLSHNNDSDFKVNTTTRTKAHQLSCATSTPQFIISLNIISKYSAQLEPVTNKLQAKSVDLYSVQNHIQDLLTIFNNNREQSDIVFNNIFNNSVFVAEKIGVEIKIPRTTCKQKNRSNYETNSAEHYYRLSIFIPYLDSLISSLSRRFSSTNKIAFSISLLHPTNIKKYAINDFKEKIKLISDHYEIENMIEESNIWYQYWIDKNLIDSQCDEISFVDLLAHCEYYPAIFQILNIFLSLPPTTCTIERSFSTLRRVKTWLRSTTEEDRLNGLCMMSLHRERVNANKDTFIQDVINMFGIKRRNLQFLFTDTE
ncbi:zinc finger MYM-type protein 1-like, partial [Aphis craccivora]